MAENGRVGETGTMRVKSGLAEMLKGGVIMDVVDAEQATIAENAGACLIPSKIACSRLAGAGTSLHWLSMTAMALL